MEIGLYHTPVMSEEVLSFLAPLDPGIVIDATVGFGGHAREILALHPEMQLIGIDRDPEAVAKARENLSSFAGRFLILARRYDDPGTFPELFEQAAQFYGHDGDEEIKVVAVLFDLGVNSYQLDNPDRGFSYMKTGDLDMRMDRSRGKTASQLLQETSVGELRDLFYANGEYKFAARLAEAIVASRPVVSTGQLSEIVEQVIPKSQRRRGHPAKRVFQALRIAVNEELIFLADALDQALEIMAVGGRLLVLSYHSGEDKIVKARFKFASDGGCQCPKLLPCRCDAVVKGKILTKSSLKPSAKEINLNSRAKSARLRVFEKTEPFYRKELP